MTTARFRQFWADLRASFWLRPAVMTLLAIVLAELLIRADGVISLPSWLEGWVYAGGTAGARDVLGTVASATIGVAGTTFSITVAALSLASSQMGPRLLRNFTSDPGNQYALGALVSTFAFALMALRSVHDAEDGAFVPQLAVSVGLLLAFGCVGVLIWFIHHVATSINVNTVVALVHGDLSAALRRLPRRSGPPDAAAEPATPDESGAPLRAPGGGYLQVLDDAELGQWAEDKDARLWLRIRPGDFVFPGSVIGRVVPAGLVDDAQSALGRALALGDTRSVEQDLEFAVRRLVEIGLRALSPGINDPFTAMAVLDRLGAALCELASHDLPSGCHWRDGKFRLSRGTTDYAGLVDAMFHMLRQAGTGAPAVMIRMLEIFDEVAAVEQDAQRRRSLRRHIVLTRDAATAATQDSAALAAIEARYARALGPLASAD
ncbi:DUF2254 domain-containing protein [Dankookia sp. GCM10030260]|uniref:DUF2254 domain-containing protein n=1 Tax=Dankookia sp. GCM10030260 TaxID=3273390 RepID=UPI003620B10B